MQATKPSQFKLEAPTAFAGPDGSAPVVGDRYIFRDKSSEIVDVTETHVVIEVADKDGCFRKSVTLDEFATLEKRTFAIGAVFKPAPNDQAQRPALGDNSK